MSGEAGRTEYHVIADELRSAIRAGVDTPIVRDGIKRLRRDTWAAGRSIWEDEDDDRALTVDKIKVHETRATAQQSAALSLEADTAVIVRERRFVLDGRPVMLAVSALPASIAAGTQIAQENTGPGGIYARLAELGHAPAHFREDLRARMPTPVEADTLDLDGGTPVVEIARTAYTDNGTAVEFNVMILDASVYVLRYDFDA